MDLGNELQQKRGAYRLGERQGKHAWGSGAGKGAGVLCRESCYKIAVS